MTGELIQRRVYVANRVDRLIDEALLLTATQTGFLYLHRRGRRALPKVVLGTGVVAGLGLVTAAAAAAAGVGLVGLAGGGLAWYRKREKSRAALSSTDSTQPTAVTQADGADLRVEEPSLAGSSD